MNASTENSTEKMLEKVSGGNPVSVYSVSFAEIINDAEREFLIEHSKAKKESANKAAFSKAIFKGRNAIAVAAILVIGILHFAFQISFIRNETSENRRVAEVPAKVEQVAEKPSDIKPDAEFELKKVDTVVPEKSAPKIKPRQPEIAPAKPQLKKKEPVETRAERLRRAEKILTGV